MDKSDKIRSLRRERRLTQEDLAGLCGSTPPSIRDFELGRRVPRGEVLGRLAHALDVSPQALVDHGMEHADRAMHALFELEDAGALARPAASGGHALIEFAGGALGDAVAEWARMRERLDRGEVGREEYDAWRDRFGADGRSGSADNA